MDAFFPVDNSAYEPGDSGAGPRSAAEWRERDPLGTFYREREAFYPEALFNTWSDFPPEARAAAWREREIASFLYANQARWQERLPNLAMVGVARRTWDQIQFPPGSQVASKFLPRNDEVNQLWRAYYDALSAETPDYGHAWHITKHLAACDPWFQASLLVGVLSITPPWETPLDIFLRLDQPPIVDLPSPLLDLDRFGLPAFLPLVVKPIQPLVPYAGFISSTSSTVQSGIKVAGPQHAGTLTAVAYQAGQEVLLGPHHVFGDRQDVLVWNQRRIGDVFQTLPDWDAALASLDAGISTAHGVAGLALTPARPMPISSLVRDVQFNGATSGLHLNDAVLDQVYAHADPALAHEIGSQDGFAIQGHAKTGDSGALIIAGHGSGSPISPGVASPNPALDLLYHQAMLGMLVAGPADDSDANMPNTFFCRSVFELAVHLNLTF